MNKISILFLLIISNLCTKAVMVDELLTEKSSLRIETSVFYVNAQRHNSIVAPVFISSSAATSPMLVMPAMLNTQQMNQDYLNFSLNLRYGITKDIQVFASPSFFYQQINVSDLGFSTQNDFGFNSFNMGFAYQVKKEDRYPSLLIGATPIVIDRSAFNASVKDQRMKVDYFKSYSFFATSFYTVDPLVFLIQGGFRFNLKRSFNDRNIKMGEVFSLSPAVYFAVNPYTSINFGIRYEYKLRDRIDNKVVINQGSSIAYFFGVSYEIDPSLIVSVDINSLNSNTYASNGIKLLFSYKIR